jgi:hypothetical protein
VPLSVATNRIGLAATRCAGLLARLAADGRPVDRAGTGVVVEVYPAAALKLAGGLSMSAEIWGTGRPYGLP